MPFQGRLIGSYREATEGSFCEYEHPHGKALASSENNAVLSENLAKRSVG